MDVQKQQPQVYIIVDFAVAVVTVIVVVGGGSGKATLSSALRLIKENLESLRDRGIRVPIAESLPSAAVTVKRDCVVSQASLELPT